MNKKSFIRLSVLTLVLTVVFVGLYIFPTFVEAPQEWVIDGDRVYVDNADVFIQASPHTITGSGAVYFNFTPKQFTGDVDIVWGFDTDEVKPTGAWLYSQHQVNTTHSYTCTADYFNYTTDPKHFWCWDNVTEYTHDNETNTTTEIGWHYELVYEHGFEWGDLGAHTTYWNTTRIEDYKDISGAFESIIYEYGGMDRWWYKRNVPVVAGTGYQVKIDMHVPIKLGSFSGKYWFAIKPSSESIQEALANGHLYYLDPWWDSNYDYCRDLTTSQSYNDHRYLVYLNDEDFTYANAKADGADFRVVNASCNSGGVEMDIWLENITATNSTFWFKGDNETSTAYSLYYGESGAVSASSGTKTFPFFIDNETTSGWTTDDGSPTVQTSVVDNTFLNVSGSVGATDRIWYPIDVSYGVIAFEAYFKQVDSTGGTDFCVFQIADGNYEVLYIRSALPLDEAANWRWGWNNGDSGAAHTSGKHYNWLYIINESDTTAGMSYIQRQPMTRTIISGIYDSGDINGSPTDADMWHMQDVGRAGSNCMFNYKWAFARPWVSPDATVIVGAEESSDSTSPLWNDTAGYLGSNTTTPKTGEAVELYAQGYDETALDWAWLATNETGVWENKTKFFTYQENGSAVATEGDWNDIGGYPAINTYDALWTSAGQGGTSGTWTGTLLVNYTKPSNSLNTSLWQTALASDTPVNYSIPIGCWNDQNPLQFNATSYHATGDIRFSCWDGSNWIVVKEDLNQDRIYEEAVYWHKKNYESPMNMSNAVASWTWFNSTWQNTSISLGTTVAWKIYYNDTSGNENVTSIQTFTFNTVPTASNLTEPAADPATFLSDAVYQFNFTVGDADGLGDIDTVIFEWDGANSTNITTTHPINSTHAIFYTSRTDEPVQAATVYKFYVNDTSNEGASVSGTFTIDKADPTNLMTFTVAGSTANQNRTYTDTVNLVASGVAGESDSDCTYQILQNGTVISVGFHTLYAGWNNLTYYTNGCFNYTGGQLERELGITQKAIGLSLSPTTAGITHPTASLMYVESNDSIGNSSATLWRNDVNITDLNGTSESLPVGTWDFVANSTIELENFTWTEQTSTVTVSAGTATITGLLNSTNDNTSIEWGKPYNTYANAINLTAVCSASIATNISVNESAYGDNYQNSLTGSTELNVLISTFTDFNGAENMTFNYTASCGDENYTVVSDTVYVYVFDSTPPQLSDVWSNVTNETHFKSGMVINISFSAYDNYNGDGAFQWNGTYDGGAWSNGTAIGVDPTNNHTINTIGMAEGELKIHIYVNDTQGNENVTDTFHYTIDDSAPLWQDNLTKVASGSTFASGVNYGFQVNWTDVYSTLNSVNFSSDYTGVWTNYTVSNSTPDIFVYNITDLPANTTGWSWKWYANDSLGTENATDTWVYKITKFSPTLEALINGTTADRQIEYGQAINFTISINTPYSVEINMICNDTNIGGNFDSITGLTLENSTLSTIDFEDWNYNNVSFNLTGNFSGDENNTGVQDEIIIYIADTTPPTVSNFNFYPLDSSKAIIGDYTYFTSTNLSTIEYMMINFTLTDIGGIAGNISLFYTANGTRACSLGNNQSSVCYNFTDGTWIKYLNLTETSNFDAKNSNQGDRINCSYTGTSTERVYTCEIDEHYNPNVWKHYPYNFSNVSWQSGLNQRIKKNTVWKIEIDTGIVPLDSEYYKLDCRLNYTVGELLPTEGLLTYLCNSTYSTGDPSTSDYCQLVSSSLPEDFQDDGTKLRGIFTSNLTSALGDIKYVLITSDSPTSKYYYVKTYEYRGTDSIRSSISNDNGASYTILSGGYETELNINWFYDQYGSDNTQFVAKIESIDDSGNDINSTEQVMSWDLAPVQNEAPIVDIIVPVITANISGTFNINWTTAEPNGDEYRTNITIINTTGTSTITTEVDSSISTYSWDTTTFNDGDYNLTVISYENGTADKLSGNDTHEITIDNTAPSITSETDEADQDYDNSNTLDFSAIVDDAIDVDWVYFEINGVNYTSPTNNSGTWEQGISMLAAGTYSWFWYANDTLNNQRKSTGGSITINQAAGTLIFTLDGDNVGAQSRTFLNMTTILAIESDEIDMDATYGVLRNGTDVLAAENDTSFSLNGSTVWNYTFYRLGATNFTDRQVEIILTMNQNASTSNYIILLLDGTAANETVTYGNMSNVTAYNDSSVFDSQTITFTLYRNSVLIGTNGLIEDRLVLANGTWNYTYNTSGNANYSAGQVDYSVLVLKADPTNNMSITIDGDDSVTQSRTFPNMTTVIVVENATGDSDITPKLYRNGTDVTVAENDTSFRLNGSTVHNYTYHFPQGGNWSEVQIEIMLTMNQNTSTQDFMNLTIDSLEANKTTAYPSPINATAWNDSSVFDSQTITFKLYRNNGTDEVTVGTNGLINETILLKNATHNYTLYTEGNDNYTSTNKNFFVFVEKGNPINNLTLTIDGSSSTEQSRTHPNQTVLLAIEINGGDSDVDYTVLRNISGIDSDVTATENNTGIILDTAVHNYTLNSSGGENWTAVMKNITLTINQNTSTSNYMTILLDGTAANETVTYGNVSNATAYNDSSVFDDQTITFRLYRNDALVGTNGVMEDRLVLPNGTHTYITNTSGNANYSAGTINFTVFVLKNDTGTIKDWNLNDTYINFNQSVRIEVNASIGAAVIVEVTQSGETKNYTLPWNGTWYNYDFTKTDFGDTNNNATMINMSKLYFGGVNYTANSNITAPMNSSYGTTNAILAHDYPDPITNAPGQHVNIWTHYNSTEDEQLTGSTCQVDIFGGWKSMSFDATDKRYEVLLSTESKTIDIYQYNISCTNTSYKSQWKQGTLEVTTGGGTAPAGGGASGPSSPCSEENVICYLDAECCEGLICSRNRCIKEEDLPGDFEFVIYPVLIQPSIFLSIAPLSTIIDNITITNKEVDKRMYPIWGYVCPGANETCMKDWCVASLHDPNVAIDGIAPEGYAVLDVVCVVPRTAESGKYYDTNLFIWPSGYNKNISKVVKLSIPVEGNVSIADIIDDIIPDIELPSVNYTEFDKFIAKVKRIAGFNILCLTKSCADDNIWFIDFIKQPIEIGPVAIAGITPTMLLVIVIVVLLFVWPGWVRRIIP